MSNTIEKLRGTIAAGLKTLGIAADTALLDNLLVYLAQLDKWNKAYNLTAVRNPAEMVTRHILDSYTIAPYIKGTRIIDVGTGAGLPGIPLALLNPQQNYTLLDTNGKKVRFLQHVVGELGLSNVTPVQSRVEEFQPAEGFDTVVCRAFTSVNDFIAGSGHLLAPAGQLVAMKGKLPAEEMSALPPEWLVAVKDPLQVPGLDGERHAIVLQRA